MAQNMRIRMTYEDGSIHYWTVRSAQGVYNLNLGQRPRKTNGWEYTSHDGCTRFAEGSWVELVASFCATARNYGMTCNLS